MKSVLTKKIYIMSLKKMNIYISPYITCLHLRNCFRKQESTWQYFDKSVKPGKTGCRAFRLEWSSILHSTLVLLISNLLYCSHCAVIQLCPQMVFFANMKRILMLSCFLPQLDMMRETRLQYTVKSQELIKHKCTIYW